MIFRALKDQMSQCFFGFSTKPAQRVCSPPRCAQSILREGAPNEDQFEVGGGRWEVRCLESGIPKEGCT